MQGKHNVDINNLASSGYFMEVWGFDRHDRIVQK